MVEFLKQYGMNVTHEKFDEMSKLYDLLLTKTMEHNEIAEIECKDKSEYFFDRVRLVDGKLQVFSHGLKKPFKGLCFDFTVDYAKCVSNIEFDLYLYHHNASQKHGMYFRFKEKED